MNDWLIAADDPRREDVVAILRRHLEFANEHSPPEDVHALDLDGLADPSVTFFSLRERDVLLGVGAVKMLTPSHAELKSIHTAETVRGRGVGRAMVQHLIDVARRRGALQVSLETGSMEAFAPSRALYSSLGFVSTGPFHLYRPSPNSTFMTLDLPPARETGR